MMIPPCRYRCSVLYSAFTIHHKLEHRDLNDVIDRLAAAPILDQLQLQRLKKRKLLVKDQIAMLERQLTPDILA